MQSSAICDLVVDLVNRLQFGVFSHRSKSIDLHARILRSDGRHIWMQADHFDFGNDVFW